MNMPRKFFSMEDLMSEYEELLEALMKKYMDEGMSEFEARMKAVMSQESMDKVYPGLKKEVEETDE
jgi:hypothetical protein